jgi:hypothetical protein
MKKKIEPHWSEIEVTRATYMDALRRDSRRDMLVVTILILGALVFCSGLFYWIFLK